MDFRTASKKKGDACLLLSLHVAHLGGCTSRLVGAIARSAQPRAKAAEPAATVPTAEPAAAEPAAAKPMAADPTVIEPTLDHTTALGGGDYDYDQTCDDIGGIYDSCDDYNYDFLRLRPRRRQVSFLFSPFCRR